jgi:hypothetical protein
MKLRANAPGILLAVLLASCTTKNDTSIEIASVCSFPDDAKKCSFSSTCEKVLMSRPWAATRWSHSRWADVQTSLDLPVQINNNMKSNADAGTFRTNTNDFTIEEFRLSFSSRQIALGGVTVHHNQLVPAGGSTVAMVPLIPPEAMMAIDAENLPTTYNSVWAPNAAVDVTIKAFGHTRDGHSITTEGWVVPVDVYDVDVIASNVRSFDPVCTSTTATSLVACPHPGQSASITCE